MRSNSNATSSEDSSYAEAKKIKKQRLEMCKTIPEKIPKKIILGKTAKRWKLAWRKASGKVQKRGKRTHVAKIDHAMKTEAKLRKKKQEDTSSREASEAEETELAKKKKKRKVEKKKKRKKKKKREKEKNRKESKKRSGKKRSHASKLEAKLMAQVTPILVPCTVPARLPPLAPTAPQMLVAQLPGAGAATGSTMQPAFPKFVPPPPQRPWPNLTRLEIQHAQSPHSTPLDLRGAAAVSQQRTSLSSSELRALIKGIYERHNPAKLLQFSSLMQKYEGFELDVYLYVCKKYGEKPEVADNDMPPASSSIPSGSSKQILPSGISKPFAVAKKASALAPPKICDRPLSGAVPFPLIPREREQENDVGWPFVGEEYSDNASSESACSAPSKLPPQIIEVREPIEFVRLRSGRRLPLCKGHVVREFDRVELSHHVTDAETAHDNTCLQQAMEADDGWEPLIPVLSPGKDDGVQQDGSTTEEDETPNASTMVTASVSTSVMEGSLSVQANVAPACNSSANHSAGQLGKAPVPAVTTSPEPIETSSILTKSLLDALDAAEKAPSPIVASVPSAPSVKPAPTPAQQVALSNLMRWIKPGGFCQPCSAAGETANCSGCDDQLSAPRETTVASENNACADIDEALRKGGYWSDKEFGEWIRHTKLILVRTKPASVEQVFEQQWQRAEKHIPKQWHEQIRSMMGSFINELCSSPSNQTNESDS